MESEWRELTLGEMIRLQRGHDLTDPQRTVGEVPVFGSAGLNGYHGVSRVKGPGVVIGRSGASFGKVHFSSRDYWPHNTALYVTDFLGNDELFTFHFLQTVDFSSFNSGSAQPSLNRNHIYLMPVRVPPLMEQRAIAHILGSLDDKIELNRRMNETLEGMAQALFKSWFVDFDPVIDNALVAGNPIPEELADRAEVRRAALANGTANREAAKPFPAGFQPTEELGWIPEGWAITTSSSLFDVRDGTHDSPKQSDIGRYLITSRHIIGTTIDFSNAYLISEEDYEQANKRSKVDPYDILLTMIGTVGIPFLVMEETIDFAIKNVGLFKTGVDRTLATFFYLYLKSEFMTRFMDSRLAGTTQKFLTLKILRAIPLAIPDDRVMNRFGTLTRTVFEKIHMNNKASESLTNLRDTLLPKLISGELRIPDAAKLAESALA
ncbi:MAG: restriction endonuclease subunit S [Pirellula sp.]